MGTPGQDQWNSGDDDLRGAFTNPPGSGGYREPSAAERARASRPQPGPQRGAGRPPAADSLRSTARKWFDPQGGELGASEQRIGSAVAHVVVNFIPFGLLLGLVGWVFFENRGDFLRGHLRAVLNFQLIMILVSLAAFIPVIGWAISLAGWVVQLVFGVMGAIAALGGKEYRYPISLPLFR